MVYDVGFWHLGFGCGSRGLGVVQGHLAHSQTPPLRTLSARVKSEGSRVQYGGFTFWNAGFNSHGLTTSDLYSRFSVGRFAFSVEGLLYLVLGLDLFCSGINDCGLGLRVWVLGFMVED